MTDLENQLDRIAREVLILVPAETVIIARFEDGGSIVHYVAGVGKHAGAIVGKKGETATSGLCGVVREGNCPVLVGKTEGDTRIRQDIAVALGITTALAVPIEVNNELFGAIMVLNRTDGGEFTDSDSIALSEYARLLTDRGENRLG